MPAARARGKRGGPIGVDRGFMSMLASLPFMRLSILIGSSLLALLSPAAARATNPAPGDVIAQASAELVAPSPFADNPLLEQIHRAQLDATQADVSLSAPLPPGARLPAGPVSARAARALLPGDDTLRVVTMSGVELTNLLERAARIFAPYTFEPDRPLLEPGAAESLFVTAEGLVYEIDLTAAPGHRLVNVSRGGAALAADQALRVVITARTARRLGVSAPATPTDVARADAWIARLRKVGTLDNACEANWSVLPDFAPTPERAAIDRLVRLGVAPTEEVRRLLPDQTARRGDLAYWLSRAYGWRESKLSGAYSDVPDSLEPWLDGLVRRRVIGPTATDELFKPFAPVALPLALEWCEETARHERYALDTEAEREAFRRGLLIGTGLPPRAALAKPVTLTRGQVLAMISNLRFPWIRVLYTCDFHGQMTAGSDTRGRPGSAAFAGVIARLEAENPEGTMLLDGGDAFQGTMVSNLVFGRSVVEQMNRLGYTAMAIGNHEFDWSVDTLVARIAELRSVALAANLTDLRTGERPRWARADTLVRRLGVRVGILGLAFTETPSVSLAKNVRGFGFGDDSIAAAIEARALRKRGAQAVVGIGHVPASTSGARVAGRLARLANGVPDVDAWLGGHSHNRVEAEIGGKPVLIPGAHGEAVGVVDLVLDPERGRVVERRHRLVDVASEGGAPDSAMAAIVARWDAGVAAAASTTIGRCTHALFTKRDGESPIGSVIADQMRALTGADIALQNAGGIRAGLPQGTVTRGMVFEVLPFENTLVTLELTGAEVRRSLEAALSDDRVTQVSGIRYRFDPRRDAGSRLTQLLGGDGRPLEDSRTYKVACNDFMAQGPLGRGHEARDSGIALRQALEDRVRQASAQGGALEYEPDGRIVSETAEPTKASR
jgi:2',3'-cyclic-nucleotide 2'-phosphodiesterase/3'-nucleotidase